MGANASGLFDGTTSRITYGNNLGPAGTHSFCFGIWHKDTSATPTTKQVIAGKVDNATGQGWWLAIRGDVAGDPYEFGILTAGGVGCVVQAPRVSDTNWHHICVNYAGTLGTTLMAVLVDGGTVAKTVILNNLAGGDITNSKNFQISGQDGTNNLYDGSLAQAFMAWKTSTSTGSTVREFQQIMHHSNKNYGATPAGAVPSVFYAPLDTSGNMGRDLIGGLTPTVTGVTYQTSTFPVDVFASAASLTWNGTTDHIGFGAGIVTNQDMAAFTYVAWVYATSQGEGSVGRIVCKAANSTNGWHFHVSSTGALTLFVDYATNNMILQTSNGTFSLNAWHKVVCTFGSATATNNHIYIDDVEPSYQTTQNGTGARVTDSGTSENVGNIIDQSATWAGQIAAVQVYNAQLTLAQTKEIKITRPYLSGGNLIGQRWFNGWNFLDLSGNNAHGSFFQTTGVASSRPALSYNAPLATFY